jgi:cell shape-determining protein MreD
VSYLLALPVLFLTMMIQMVVINKLSLLYGYADLMVLVLIVYGFHPRTKGVYVWAILAGLMFGLISKLPVLVPVFAFVLTTWGTQMIKRRIWQMPILAYIFLVIAATFIFQIASLITLIVTGSPLPFIDSLNLIIIPSVLLNLILAIPVYYILNDFLGIVFTEKDLL